MYQFFDLLYKFTLLGALGFIAYHLWPVLGLLVRVLNHIAKWFGG
jgi:hypothetical protein